MKISAYNSINSYSKVISDYKSIRRKITPEKSSVQFKENNFQISSRRAPNEITQFIIDTNLKSSPKIDNKEKKKKDVIEKYDGHLALLRRAPILDRFDFVIEKLKRGEFVSATTMGVLSIVYGPEDLREVHSAYKQIKELCTKGKWIEEYDYKVAQHPASFFRGSILHKSLNPFATKIVDFDKMSEFGKWWHKTVAKFKVWLLEKDKALIDTKFGKKFIKNILRVDINYIKTPIEEILQDGKVKNLVDAYQYISDNKFGKLTARAMTRVPVIGNIADATIEALEVRNDVMKGENFFESLSKATIRYGTSTITTAYLGAVGSKAGPIGALGSLTLANNINDKIEQIID